LRKPKSLWRKEAKQPVRKRKRMDKGMECIKTAKTEDCVRYWYGEEPECEIAEAAAVNAVEGC